MLTTIKLFSPLYARLYERNERSDLDYDSVDVGADELCAYQEAILQAIERDLDTEGKRGLAVYLDNAMLKRKVYSMKPAVELGRQALGRAGGPELCPALAIRSG